MSKLHRESRKASPSRAYAAANGYPNAYSRRYTDSDANQHTLADAYPDQYAYGSGRTRAVAARVTPSSESAE
jgi:hypothetical protein